jgi:hypothetical protein
MKHEERKLQIVCVNYLKVTRRNWLFIKGNYEGKISAIAGKREKDMGYISGTPDLTIFPTNGKPFFVEFKTKEGRLSQSQKDWACWCSTNEYDYYVCRSANEFLDIIRNY